MPIRITLYCGETGGVLATFSTVTNFFPVLCRVANTVVGSVSRWLPQT